MSKEITIADACQYKHLSGLTPATKEVMVNAPQSLQSYLNTALMEVFNSSLCGASRGLYEAGFAAKQAVEVLYHTPGHREPVGNEIERAVDLIYGSASGEPVKKSLWPVFKTPIAEVLANIKQAGIEPMTESELLRRLGDTPEIDNVSDFLSEFFRGVELPIYLGTKKEGIIEYTTNWLRQPDVIEDEGYDQVLANPMRRKLTLDERSKCPSGGRKIEYASETLDVITFECDKIPDELQFAVIAYLAKRLPLLAIVDSANKSHHATFSAKGLSYDCVMRLRRAMVDLGGDGAVMSPYQLVRLGAVNRSDKGQGFQRVLWIDGDARHEDADKGKVLELLSNPDEMALPSVVSMAGLMMDYPEKPDAVIEGVLGIGDKLIVSAPSKAGKTWLMLGLAYAVQNGTEWMGHNCKKLNVLYVNFELTPAWIAERGRLVSRCADGLDHPDMLNLKNHSVPWHKLSDHVRQHIEDSGKHYGFIILDPIYKMLEDKDENSNGDIARLLNDLGKMSLEIEAATAFSHHHSKGNKSGVDAIDRMAGAGVWARDPDAIIDLVSHEDDDCYVVETVPRNYVKPPKVVVQSVFPGFVVVDDADPAALRKPGGSKKKASASEIVAFCEDNHPMGLTMPRLIENVVNAFPFKDGTARQRINEAIMSGELVVIGDKKLIKPTRCILDVELPSNDSAA